MGELSDYAKRNTEDQRKFQLQSEAKKDAEKELSRSRAEEFVVLMRKYQIPQIPMCYEGEEPFLRQILASLRPNPYRSELEKPHRKVTVMHLGWIAINDISSEVGETPTGLFVSNDMNAYQCSTPRTSGKTEYVTPRYNSRSVVPDETALAAYGALDGLLGKIAELGIEP